MSRDHVLPRFFSKLHSQGAPVYAIYTTVGLILVFVLLFDPSPIAKLAGAFQLMMFALSCLAVIVMRESRIESYDPRYRSPFYPWLHILGVLAPFWLIVQMGLLPSLFTGGLIIFGAMWYNYYARERVDREGAIFHVFERLGRQRDTGLDRELRQIMKEKGLRDADPFEEVVTSGFDYRLARRNRIPEHRQWRRLPILPKPATFPRRSLGMASWRVRSWA